MLKKLMIVALLCVSFSIKSEDISNPKTINWGNVAKATFVSGASAICALFYYRTIIEPYIVIMIKENGLAATIDFNKKFVKNHPRAAFMFAIPLCASIGFALIARDYMNKIWKKQKNN